MKNDDISVLNLTVRSYNALKRMGINTVAELETRTADVMKMLPKTYPRILKAVEEYRGKPIVSSENESARTYKEIFLEHFPDFDVSRFDEFAVNFCIATFFDDIGQQCPYAGEDGYGKCKKHWENKCLFEWRKEIDESDLKDVEKYLIPKADETPAQELIPAPAEETPAVFDYSELDSDTADKLRAVSEKVISIKARYILETAKQVKIAHDLLASHDKTKGLFGAWCASVGFSRDTGNNLVRVAEVFPELDVAENFGNISPSLLYAASKPSAPPELVEGVKNGDITTHKDFIKLKKELDEANKRAENAEICRNEIIETNRHLVETCDKHYKNVQKLENRVKELDGEKNELLCEIKELENRPVEVQQPDEEAISVQANEMARELIRNAESAADKRIRDYKEKLDSRSKEFTKELENLRNENTRLKDGVLHMVIQLTLDEYGALIKLTQGNEALCSAIKHSHIFKS